MKSQFQQENMPPHQDPAPRLQGWLGSPLPINYPKLLLRSLPRVGALVPHQSNMSLRFNGPILQIETQSPNRQSQGYPQRQAAS